MKLQTPTRKIIVQVPLDKIGINQIELPKGAAITSVKASPNNHSLSLYALVDQSTTEIAKASVAVIPAGMTVEVEDDLNFIGSDWVKDVFCSAFLVTPKATNPVNQEDFNHDGDDEQAIEPDSNL